MWSSGTSTTGSGTSAPAILASANYDPAIAVTKDTATLAAMTAVDTTNLRVAFTVPANGVVRLRMSAGLHGSTAYPRILLGVLSGASVVARVSPLVTHIVTGAATQARAEVDIIIPGLTPAANLTWDAAYGVDVVQASTSLVYGGPNDATGDDAFGAFKFEVWTAPDYLGALLYDPASVASLVTTSLLAMTALDTTNARLTITAPSSGKIRWRVVAPHHGTGTFPTLLLGVLEASTVVGRALPLRGQLASVPAGATSAGSHDASGLITGLTPGSSHTYDAAYAVQVVAGAGGALKWGGPNNTTTNDAFGALVFEITSA